MIVVDSSIVVAIIRRESEAEVFSDLLNAADNAVMSAVAFVETNMVASGRRLGANPQRVTSMVAVLGIEISEVTTAQAGLAVDAFMRFGKGRHPAALNLADCFSYALAKFHNAPLFFKGNDFAQTDIVAAWRP